MKKLFALIAVMLCLCLCSCTTDTSGCKTELVSKRWYAETKGGGSVDLSFCGESASLTLKNAGETAVIKGRYLADDNTLVIFSPEISQNYCFEYTPKGERLELSYNGFAVELDAK